MIMSPNIVIIIILTIYRNNNYINYLSIVSFY